MDYYYINNLKRLFGMSIEEIPKTVMTDRIEEISKVTMTNHT